MNKMLTTYGLKEEQERQNKMFHIRKLEVQKLKARVSDPESIARLPFRRTCFRAHRTLQVASSNPGQAC